MPTLSSLHEPSVGQASDQVDKYKGDGSLKTEAEKKKKKVCSYLKCFLFVFFFLKKFWHTSQIIPLHWSNCYNQLIMQSTGKICHHYYGDIFTEINCS